MFSDFILAFVVFLLIFILRKKHVRKSIGGSESRAPKFQRFTQFFRPIPLLDGILVFYQARKYGVTAANNWMKRVDENSIVEASLGSFNLIFQKNPKLSHKLLGSSDPGHLSRPLDIYHRIFIDFMTKGLFGTEVNEWLQQRKVISKAFTFRTFQHYTKLMNKHSKNLVSDLLKLCDKTGGLVHGPEMYSTIHLNTLKITLEFLLGNGFTDTGEALGFSKNVLRAKEIVTHRLLHPELYFPPFWWIHPMRRELQRRLREMNNFVEMVVDYYRSRSDLAAINKNSTDEKNDQRCLIEEMVNQNATTQEIYCETGTFLIAGFDTVWASIRFLLQHLACHPEYQIRCRQQVDNLFGTFSDDSDMERDLSVNDLSKLEYLERFINESLRMTPTVPVLLRELNTPLNLDENNTLPKGKIVAISPFVIHHNPKYWPNPEIFNPDRFLPEEVEKREPGTFIPFSAGLRNCIGKRFAMLEMKTLLVWILRNFEVYSEDRMLDVKLRYEISMVPERDYRIKLKRRTFSSE